MVAPSIPLPGAPVRAPRPRGNGSCAPPRMFKYLGPETRKAVRLACEAAKSHRYHYVGTEHLLHGVLWADAPALGRILGGLGVEIDKVVNALEEIFKNHASDQAGALIPFTARARRAIESAREIAAGGRRELVTCPDLLVAILGEATGVAAQIARRFALDEVKLRRALEAQPQAAATGAHAAQAQGQLPAPKPPEQADPRTGATTRSRTPALDAFGTDLVRRAREGALDPVIGREGEMERILQVLTRRSKNNPVLVGEPGTGKSALVEGIAQRIAHGDVPPSLRGKRIVSLDIPLMLAGTRYRGEFEERLERVIKEAETDRQVILFVDEMHTLVGAGSGEGTLDAVNILKPGLSRARIQMIGATTTDEFREHIEKDGTLERRFQPIVVREADRAETEAILEGLRPKLEAHHRVAFEPGAIELAVGLADRYIAGGRANPDKSIDVIDEAASAARLRASRMGVELKNAGDADRATALTARRSHPEAARKRACAKVVVTREDVRATVARMTGISLGNVQPDRPPLDLEEALEKRVIGQKAACRAVARAVRRAAAGLKDPQRPAGAFLFVGPSGVGKTLLARALAATLYGTEDALIAVDMSELMERHDASKLTGAPPGYVGHDRPSGLCERVRRRPQSVVLLDEVDKAHPSVLNLFLQILDEGRLTDGSGRVVDFRHALVVMTANLARADGNGFGFAGGDDARRQARAAIEEHFRPELLNRLDNVIVFERLGRVTLEKVLEVELEELRKRLAEKKNTLTIDGNAIETLLSDPLVGKNGARPIRRLVEDRIVTPLVDMMLRGEVRPGDEVTVRSAASGALELRSRSRPLARLSPLSPSADTAPLATPLADG